MSLHEVTPAQSAPRYEFSRDWFTRNLPLFERYLVHLKNRPCRLLEIGSYEGRSTTWLLDNIATHPSAVIDAVELQEHPQLRTNLTATGHAEKVRLHFGPSVVVLRTLPFDIFDFVYIDGCHWTVETLEDAVLAFRLAKSDAVVAFDDYLWDDPQQNEQGRPKEAVDAFLAIYADQIELLHRKYQVWTRKKRPEEIIHSRRPAIYSELQKWIRQPRKKFLALTRPLGFI
jgi:hypothetical protein